MKRIVLAAIAGGFIMFIWGAISHTLLPLGTMGLKVMPDEDAALESMRKTLPGPGLYIFPGLDPSSHPSEAEMKVWTEKYQRGPRGILAYRPTGAQPFDPMMLGMELLSNLLSAGIAALIVSQIFAS